MDELSRRQFLKMCGGGLLVAASGIGALAAWPGSAPGQSGQGGDVHGYRSPGPGVLDAPGTPLDLPPWKYGADSAAPDTVLMFRGNPARNFYGTGPLRDAPEPVWSIEMDRFDSVLRGLAVTWAGTGWTGQPCRLGDWVFVGGVDRCLYAINAADGRIGWRLRADRMFKSSACLYENRLYIGNVDNLLRCVDAATGRVLWTIDTYADLDSSPCVSGGRLYIAGENGHVRCLDPATGARHWNTFVGGIGPGTVAGSNGSETSPAVFDGLVYTATYDGILHCLDAADGHHVWRAPTGDDTDASPVVHGDFVYAAAEEKASSLYCFDRRTGRLAWTYGGNSGGYWSTPAVAGGRVFIGGTGGLHCVDAATGRRSWMAKTNAAIWSSPCVIGDRVVFGCWDGHLYIVDAVTGAVTWRHDLGGRVLSTPCIVNGEIYVGTATGKFFCFK